ncbi:MAG: hypothetical protein QM638_07395 [Nocardioides sp.]|uniref:hypothetical protein n=1 Tax=Nocardioides sp. TaxID=35761 RepID=UPI0039E2A842
MAWEEELFGLFDELEAQAAAAYALDREAELADRSRAEYAEVTLAGRLMASLDTEIVLGVLGVGDVAGRLQRVGRGWALLTGASADWVVELQAVGAVGGASERAVPQIAWPAYARLGLGSALRRLAEAGERCVLHRRDGVRHDGTLRRVGADFVEVVTGEPAHVVLLTFETLAAVQSRS